MEPVAHHQPPAVIIDLVLVSIDISGDFRQQRRGQHLPSAVTSELIEQRTTHRRRGVDVGLALLLNYLEHGRALPNRRANAGPDQ